MLFDAFEKWQIRHLSKHLLAQLKVNHFKYLLTHDAPFRLPFSVHSRRNEQYQPTNHIKRFERVGTGNGNVPWTHQLKH